MWEDHAACREPGADPEWFWPSGWSEADRRQVAQVVEAYCDRCPVLDECAALGERLGAVDGVWGGARRHRPRATSSKEVPGEFCGTMTGYYRHRRLVEALCGPCAAAYAAHLAANAARRRRKTAQARADREADATAAVSA
jgi:WhiB family redox-sensing transcriptional regulator